MVVQTSALPGITPLSLALASYLIFKGEQAAQNTHRMCQRSRVAGEVWTPGPVPFQASCLM